MASVPTSPEELLPYSLAALNDDETAPSRKRQGGPPDATPSSGVTLMAIVDTPNGVDKDITDPGMHAGAFRSPATAVHVPQSKALEAAGLNFSTITESVSSVLCPMPPENKDVTDIYGNPFHATLAEIMEHLSHAPYWHVGRGNKGAARACGPAHPPESRAAP